MKISSQIVWIFVIIAFTLIASCGNETDSGLQDALNKGYITKDINEADGFTPPQGSLIINDGEVATNKIDVILKLSGSDAVGVTGYNLSTNSDTPSITDSNWESVTSTTSFSKQVSETISAVEKSYSFYAWYRDAVGGISERTQSSIIYDVTAPANPSVSINSGASSTSSTSVTLTLSATDSVGVTGYYASESSTKPASSNSGWKSVSSATSYSGSVSFSLSSATGTKTLYVWFRDVAGNISDSASDNIMLTTGSSPRLLYSFDDGEVHSNFTMSGNANWAVTSSTYATRTHSLKSGAIVHNQTSCVSIAQTTVAGVYSFYYKTSSDSTDYLKFYIDNSAITTASGSSSSSFTKYHGTVSSAGSHTFKWCYEKDSATSEGSDAVWIDEILMPLEAKPFSSVSAGENHTCATDNNSSATCWGRGSYGRLGYSSSGTSNKYTPISVSGISTATAVSSGGSHTCAVLSSGTVKCWGLGSYGRLGNGSTSNQYTPVSVSGISTATSVSSGGSHTCAVLSSGTVRCWGLGSYGRLGYSSSGTSTQYTPVSVSGISTAAAVSAGGSHTCAVLSSGTVKCWGLGSYGRLGICDGCGQSQYTPVSVEPLFLDQSGPTGSFAIINKSSYSTGYNRTFSFTLTAADSTAIVAYYLSTSSSTPSSSSSSWTSVSETTSLSKTVTSSKYLYSGNNNFYVWYKDVLGNISAQYSDSMYCNSSTCY